MDEDYYPELLLHFDANSMELRKITQEEWEAYEWLEVRGGYFLRGLKKADPPPYPNDGMAYTLIDKTTVSDSERVYQWVPVYTRD